MLEAMHRLKPAVLLFALVLPAAAQWLNHPDPSTPRTRDGKPNLNAPMRKTRDGKPDLSGVWMPTMLVPAGVPATAITREDFIKRNTVGRFTDGAEPPLLPAADKLYQQRTATLGAGRPSERCLPHGIPDAMLVPAPFKFVQAPGITMLLYEEFNHYRQIYTDGRKLPVDPNPAWLGYSIGKWDKDTFVVESAGFNDGTWVDDIGHPHSDALHTTERYRRRDFGHMDLDITIDDAKTYARPWQLKLHLELMPDTDLIEDVCDNEKDARHAVGQ
jgi:hypothetical protein